MANDNLQQQNNPEVQQAVNAALNEAKKKKKRKKLIILGIVFAVILVIIIAACSSGSSDDSSTKADKNSASSSMSAEKEKSDDSTIGDYKCVIKGAKITKDWQGKNAVIVTYEFTNNSDNAISFDSSLDAKVFQDGIELETAVLSDDDDAKLFDTVDLKPGITKEVKKAYLLRNKDSELEVEVQELFSFSDDVIKKTIKL